jgi:hypothetical protein
VNNYQDEVEVNIHQYSISLCSIISQVNIKKLEKKNFCTNLLATSKEILKATESAHARAIFTALCMNIAKNNQILNQSEREKLYIYLYNSNK